MSRVTGWALPTLVGEICVLSSKDKERHQQMQQRRRHNHGHEHHGHGTQGHGRQRPASSNSSAASQAQDGSTRRRVDHLDNYIRNGGVIGLNDTGPGIIQIQEMLGKLGFPVQATGVYGPMTEDLVRQAQTQIGVQATGKIGPTTLAAMRQSLNIGRSLGKADAYRDGTHLGAFEVFEVDGVAMTRETAVAWKKMKAAAEADGVRLRLNSGFRSMAEQQDLYRKWQNGTGNRAAYPGYSNHQNGVALDIDVVADSHYNWMHANGNRFGFKRTVSDEPWHWEYLP